ncbi:MAG: hypothetical protein JNK16_11185 [Phycisphaerales bacterium]|nr:hypothetical protein [Phycisphaerales bacterium]
MHPLLWFFVACVVGLLLSAIVFHVLARMGKFGNAICDACTKGYLLDLTVFYFTHGPWLAGIIWWWNCDPLVSRLHHSFASFAAVIGTAVLAQMVTLVLWSWMHEAMNPGIRKGPRIVSTLNRRVGWFRNHAAVWWTAWAVPLFTMIRLGEILLYPPLHWLVRLPKYNVNEWINISRQKFSGLVGYDLIWCLYCDWMTGVWSLGSEMLRNVESFWCPIKYSSPEKCEKCCIDFPDINGGWVDARGNIAEVAELLEKKYPGPGGLNGWFGHPTRVELTVRKTD